MTDLTFRLSRRPVSLAAVLVLGAGLALTGILSVWLAKTETNRLEKAFERAADLQQAAFQHELDDAMAALTLVNHLFSRDGEIARREFQGLAEQLIESHPYVQAFSFARVVSSEQRRGFETQLQKLHGDAGVTEIREGKLIPAPGKARYHVIDQIAPAASTNLPVGLEISSIPGKDAALERAHLTGLPSATGMFSLSTDAGSERAFAVLMPVYQQRPVRNAASTSTAIVGYTSIILRAPAFMETVMQRTAIFRDQATLVSIRAENDSAADTIFQAGPAYAGVADTGGITRSIDAAGMRWLIVSKRAPEGIGQTATSAWMVLAGGAAVSILLALYLQSLAVRASDLARANTRLSKDIETRKRIESALRASEERFQRLTRMSSDWYWEQDAEFRFTMISGDTIFGDTPTQDLIGKTRWEVPLEVEDKDFDKHVHVIKSHEPFTDIEYHVRDRSGRVHWMSISGEPMFSPDGAFLGYRGTGKDITARKETEQALRQSQTELRELAAHQARVKEDERKRIAREIHDDLGQNLMALRIDVSLLEKEVHSRHPALGELVQDLLFQVDNVVRSVRAIVNDLRPAVLDLGLQCAVEWQVQQFRQRTGVSCTLAVEGGDIDGLLDEEAATSVFRILQESLTNVSRHAYANHVDIRLQRHFDGLVLEISDDGVGGFPGNMRKPRSFGLIGIRERVLTLGGEFHLNSAPGKGTTLTIKIPASATSAAAA